MKKGPWSLQWLSEWLDINAPTYTVSVISDAVFTADHLPNTDKTQQYTKIHNSIPLKNQTKKNIQQTKLPWFRHLLQHLASK